MLLYDDRARRRVGGRHNENVSIRYWLLAGTIIKMGLERQKPDSRLHDFYTFMPTLNGPEAKKLLRAYDLLTSQLNVSCRNWYRSRSLGE